MSRLTMESVHAFVDRLRDALPAAIDRCGVPISSVIVDGSYARGDFLPDDDPRAARALAVLGSKLASELFRGLNPLGQAVRIGGERYRVVGVMESKGQMLGFDLDDTVFIPAARALAMFNRDSLMEIDVLFAAGNAAERVSERLKA